MTLETKQKYLLTEKGKTMKRKANKRYYQKHKGEINKQVKKYKQSEHGKIVNRKKNAKRKRDLGFIILVENQFNCDVDYHHINDEYVVAVPRYIHQGTLGKNHRAKCNILVEKLYNISIENEVEKYEKNEIYVEICE